MESYKRRRAFARVAGSPLAVAALFILVLVLARSVYSVYKKERAASEGEAAALRELAELKTRDEFLRTKIGHLETPTGMEEALREQLSLAKPGEGVIVIGDASTTAQAATSTKEKSWWESMKDFFR